MGVACKPVNATPTAFDGFAKKKHGWSEQDPLNQFWIKPRNPIDENPKKRLNNCSTLYNCHNQNKKKSNKKKLFSEDIYTFSPVSLIDVSVLPRHFKFSSLYTRGGLQKTSLATPIIWLPFFLSMPGQFSLYKLFWFLPFFPFLFPPIYLFWYRCSNATFLLITKFCPIWVVKYTNSLNAKL